MATKTETNNLDLQEQFEIELCWCVQQLQNALIGGKLSVKQVQEHKKALNTLTSNKLPAIQKRQTMRLSFGDYRTKMAAETIKSGKLESKLKVAPIEPNKKSVFIKQAVKKRVPASQTNEDLEEKSNNCFKFLS